VSAGSSRRVKLKFTFPVLIAVAIVALVAGLLAARALAFGGGGSSAEGEASPASTKQVDVIVKATDSAFWQTMLAGSRDASKDLGVEVGLFGPPSETDIDEQVQLVENSISRSVDAIVLASNATTALNSSINRARQQGIKVITVDNPVTTESEGFIGTDNRKAGSQAGTRLCDLLKEQSPEGGKVLIESAVAGVQVLIDRDGGFKSQFQSECPDYELIGPRYNNNDIPTAASQVNDAITANPDLVGIFADNNVSGDGTAQAIEDNNAKDDIAVVAFDADPQEVNALDDGTIDALVVQNPYFFGYQGVVEAAMTTLGRFPPPNLDPGGVVVDKENVDEPSIDRLVHPPTAKGEG